MYAFGVMAWEVRKSSLHGAVVSAHSGQVLTGRPPFYEMTEMAATYSMLTGARPPPPDNHDISDRVLDMIERCWDRVPSRRLSVAEAVNILEIELGGIPNSYPLANA